MMRFLAGAAACFLLMTGAFLLWQGRAQTSSGLPALPPAGARGQPLIKLGAIPDAPTADPKNKEERRFDRADKDRNGTIVLAELVDPRRKPFGKLDLDQDGKLSFEEWAVKTITKFKTADANHNGGLTRAEFAATAPKPKAKAPGCSCD